MINLPYSLVDIVGADISERNFPFPDGGNEFVIADVADVIGVEIYFVFVLEHGAVNSFVGIYRNELPVGKQVF